MKIIQILFSPNNATWQGALLGLGDDGNVYELQFQPDGWVLAHDSSVIPRK